MNLFLWSRSFLFVIITWDSEKNEILKHYCEMDHTFN